MSSVSLVGGVSCLRAPLHHTTADRRLRRVQFVQSVHVEATQQNESSRRPRRASASLLFLTNDRFSIRDGRLR
ncbi:unnamed protein product [Protopolystoma xenopodis]|uniref:Uncharacterized protein n=1 Tax=Protopolystoma xenopodis TaxID=117903 RepID=A0A448WVM9_9PLAT|nr:unnamed protein product [Protopolystoma xenopodis]